MITEQQRRARQAGLGGSDAAAVMGQSPYKSPYQLWLEKTGQAEPPTLDDSEPILWGNVLEAVVAREFSRRTGLRLAQVNRTLVSKQHPFMRANLDRRIVGKPEILEIKTVRSLADDIARPDHVLQLAHYMEVCESAAGHLCYLIGGQRLALFRFERTELEPMTAALIEEERVFWHCVETRTAPKPQSIIDLRLLWPESRATTTQTATDETLAAVAELRDLTAQKKALDAAIEARQAVIFSQMQDAESLTDGDGRTLATWKTQTASRIDSKRLKTEAPELAAQYTQTTSSRVFRLAGGAA